MPINLTFYSLKEKRPKHNEQVIVLSPRSSFGFEGFEPITSNVEYCWFCVDDDGTFDGSQCCFDSINEAHHKLDDVTYGPDDSKWVLKAIVNGYILQENSYWSPEEEYHESLPYES